MKKQTRNKAGFTLVEIAIAMLVVAIGVLAVFALFGNGLDSSSKAIADTQCAMFADGVLNGLRSQSTTLAEEQDQIAGTKLFKKDGSLPIVEPTSPPPTRRWEPFWYKFLNEQTSVLVAASAVWKDGGTAPIRIWAEKDPPPQEPLTVVFTNASQRSDGDRGIVNSALRYSLTATPRYPWTGAGSVESVQSNLWTQVVRVTLKVWDGQYGEKYPKDEDALIFYTEFSNPGDL